ncbi:hypothetical protein AYO21_01160 [Fonsecaea monophora]|uniref:BZIP domain-containing protein n=1 Tax=Fonsecaea monophora TaxID=254056 RepID=A0A177FM65_9EURO|nr:hypothetical protein AYO21_01160 [Fonsecaea monophora]KAH0841607.1 hypothetical protein FOPE_07092 [Fonsecaea pedrosoi]OAG44670.1 hypothetical protein AYO21_01160 [Fonsecaea monophora]
MGLGFPTDFNAAAFDWSYPSSATSDQSTVDILDLFFESTPSVPVAHSSHLRTGSESQQSQSGFYGDAFSQSAVDASVGYASSEHSDDFWTKETTPADFGDMPSDSNTNQAKMLDRKHRRREQNRKAQSNFRQKRKQEVRRLEQEVEELRAQIAGYHKSGPTVGLTICTRCRNFFPASAEVSIPHFAASGAFSSSPSSCDS